MTYHYYTSSGRNPYNIHDSYPNITSTQALNGPEDIYPSLTRIPCTILYLIQAGNRIICCRNGRRHNAVRKYIIRYLYLLYIYIYNIHILCTRRIYIGFQWKWDSRRIIRGQLYILHRGQQ